MLKHESQRKFRSKRFYQYWKHAMASNLMMYLRSWTIFGGLENTAMASIVFLGLSHWGFLQ